MDTLLEALQNWDAATQSGGSGEDGIHPEPGPPVVGLLRGSHSWRSLLEPRAIHPGHIVSVEEQTGGCQRRQRGLYSQTRRSPPKRTKTRAARRYTGEDTSKKGDDGRFLINCKGLEGASSTSAAPMRLRASARQVAVISATSVWDRVKSWTARGRADLQGARRLVGDQPLNCTKLTTPAGQKRPLSLTDSNELSDTGAKRSHSQSKEEDSGQECSQASTGRTKKEGAREGEGRRPKATVEKAQNSNIGTSLFLSLPRQQLQVWQGQVVVMTEPPREYGYWQTREGLLEPGYPKAQGIFSGRSREGDLLRHRHHCSSEVEHPGRWPLRNYLPRPQQGRLLWWLWIASACGSFSPLKENPPGPRPLRSLKHIEGPRRSWKQDHQSGVGWYCPEHCRKVGG